MLDVFATYATDENAELNGVWQPHLDSSLLIARAGNTRYLRVMSEKFEANQQLLDSKDEKAEALSNQLMAEIYAETILLGWKDLGYQGKELAYSRENAVMILKHKDFRRVVANLADKIDAYRAKTEEAQVKN